MTDRNPFAELLAAEQKADHLPDAIQVRNLLRPGRIFDALKQDVLDIAR